MMGQKLVLLTLNYREVLTTSLIIIFVEYVSNYMSLLTLYLTEHLAGVDDLFLLKQQSRYEHHEALYEPVFH